MGIVRIARALAGRTVRHFAPYGVVLLALTLAYIDVLVAFIAVTGFGLVVGEALQANGATTLQSLAAAVPAGALAGYGAFRLWWHPFLYGGTRSITDVAGKVAEELVATLEKTGR